MHTFDARELEELLVGIPIKIRIHVVIALLETLLRLLPRRELDHFHQRIVVFH